MRLSLLLPVVEPEQFLEPEQCAIPKCKGKYFRLRQEVQKNVRDMQYDQVIARRYECLRCQRTFRVYPQGVLAGQFSQRVKGIGVMLYVLGLSYGAVALVLSALGVWMGKATVYRAVQSTAERVPGMRCEHFLEGYRTRALGADVTSVKCKGKWLPIGITVDAITGLVLTTDQLSGEDAQILKEWVAPIAQSVDARILVTDDADAFKTVADEQGLFQQVCKSQVVRNTEALIENLSQQIQAGVDRSLVELGIEPQQALADLHQLAELMRSRLPIYLAAASIMATWFAAETLMGASSTAYQYGLQGVVFDPFGASMCLFLSGFLFMRIMRRARYLTLIDFFDRRYDRFMGLLGSIMQLITYFAWTGAQIVAGGNIVHALLGWPVQTGMILVALIVTAYTTLGGLWADTALDFMQMFLTTVGITIIFVAVLGAVGGFKGMVTDASSLYVSKPFTLLPIAGEGYLGYTGYIAIFYWLAAWMAVGLGSVPAQDLMQRSMAAKNEAVSVWGSYFAGILYLVFGVMSPLIGIMMFKLNPNILPEQTEFLLVSAAMQHVSPIITALFIAALASALMSTSDSSILAGASVVTENIIPFFKPNMDGKEKLRWTRIMVVVIGIISITIALLAGTIYHLAMVAWSILLVGLFAPFAFGIYWKKANRTGAITAFFGGILSWVVLTIFFYFRTTFEACGGDFECAFWEAVYIGSTPAFAISVLLIIIVSLATQKSDAPRLVTDVDGKPLRMTRLLGLINIKKAFGNRGDEPEPGDGAAPAD